MKSSYALFLSLAAAIGLLTGACAPKVYVLDRQTVLEEEASAEWPELEARFLQLSLNKEPAAFVDLQQTQWKKKVIGVLRNEIGEEPESKTP